MKLFFTTFLITVLFMNLSTLNAVEKGSKTEPEEAKEKEKNEDKKKNKKPSDEQIKKLIVGKWKLEKEEPDLGLKMTGYITYKSDGTFKVSISFSFQGQEQSFNVEGKYSVKDGKVNDEITKSDSDMVKVGIKNTSEVVSIDKKKYTVKEDGGEETTVTRVIEKESNEEESTEDSAKP